MTRTPGKLGRTLWPLAALALLVATFAVACGDDESADDTATTTEEAVQAAAPTESDVWARQVQDRGAVFMVIKGGSEDDALIKASVPADVAGTAELHETKAAEGDMPADGMPSDTMAGDSMDGDATAGATSTTMASGMMQMVQVERIDVPAGGTVELKPGGLHIMMLDVKKTLNPGDTIEVELTFEKSGVQKVTAEVRDA